MREKDECRLVWMAPCEFMCLMERERERERRVIVAMFVVMR